MFDNLLFAPRTVSNTYAQVAPAQLCANHVQHVSCATWHKGTAQLLSLTESKSHLFEFILLAEPLTDGGGEEPEYPEKTPGDKLQKCHILKPEDSSSKRVSNPHNSIGGRVGKQTC